jgi:hypothetical protein
VTIIVQPRPVVLTEVEASMVLSNRDAFVRGDLNRHVRRRAASVLFWLWWSNLWSIEGSASQLARWIEVHR